MAATMSSERKPTVWIFGETSSPTRSEEHTSELQSRLHLVCRLLLEKKKNAHKQPGTSSTGNNITNIPTSNYSQGIRRVKCSNHERSRQNVVSGERHVDRPPTHCIRS